MEIYTIDREDMMIQLSIVNRSTTFRGIFRDSLKFLPAFSRILRHSLKVLPAFWGISRDSLKVLPVFLGNFQDSLKVLFLRKFQDSLKVLFLGNFQEFLQNFYFREQGTLNQNDCQNFRYLLFSVECSAYYLIT